MNTVPILESIFAAILNHDIYILFMKSVCNFAWHPPEIQRLIHGGTDSTYWRQAAVSELPSSPQPLP